MNDLNSLLRAVITNHEDDTVRLAYADALDELPSETVPCPSCSPYADDPCPRCNGSGEWNHGEYSQNWERCPECSGTGKFPPGYRPQRDPASGRDEGGWTNCQTCNGATTGTPGVVLGTAHRDRAEFIRVQVERARLGDSDVRTFTTVDNDRLNELHRRNRELLKLTGNCFAPTGFTSRSTCSWSRGFVYEIECSAEDFLQHADELVWHPDQKVECERCEGQCGWYVGDNINTPTDYYECAVCSGCGVVPRPCPDTAQPIRKVVLTTSDDTVPNGWGTRTRTYEDGKHVMRCDRFPGIEFDLPYWVRGLS